jgi:hypothetical protein
MPFCPRSLRMSDKGLFITIYALQVFPKFAMIFVIACRNLPCAYRRPPSERLGHLGQALSES